MHPPGCIPEGFRHPSKGISSMSQRNRKRARLMWAYGASLGRIAKALNVTVLSVAHELTQKESV